MLRTFDFVSSLRRMSVLVKKLKSNSVEAYVKGAPEVMIEICDKSTRAYLLFSILDPDEEVDQSARRLRGDVVVLH